MTHLKPRLLLGFAIAFAGGLMGEDPTAIVFVVIGTFISAMTVLASLSTAVVGTSLNWAASRMIRQR